MENRRRSTREIDATVNGNGSSQLMHELLDASGVD